MINLLDVIKYWGEKPQQLKAVSYLQDAIPAEVMRKFAAIWREPEPEPVKKNLTPLDMILQRMEELGLSLDQPTQGRRNRITLVGLEGVNPDYTLNPNTPNHFNDLILVVETDSRGIVSVLGKCVSTTEPGRFYTLNPMNSRGAARLAIDVKHDSIWQVGAHGSGSSRHEALIQIGNQVCVYRDGNKDFSRVGDHLDCGYFGINMHWGYGYPVEDVGKASAGCAVIRDRGQFNQAMSNIKTDHEFQNNSKQRFSFVLLDGEKVFKKEKGEEEKKGAYEYLDLAMKLLIEDECYGDVRRCLNAYADPGHGWSIPTIGIGTIVYSNGTKVRRGDTITVAQAHTEAKHFIRTKIEPGLARIPGYHGWTDKMKVSMILFAYNLGPGFYQAEGFATISKALQNKDYKAVAQAMNLYNKSNGVVMSGLVSRRKKESNLWLSGLA